jgi:hypothetical protein
MSWQRAPLALRHDPSHVTRARGGRRSPGPCEQRPSSDRIGHRGLDTS